MSKKMLRGVSELYPGVSPVRNNPATQADSEWRRRWRRRQLGLRFRLRHGFRLRGRLRLRQFRCSDQGELVGFLGHDALDAGLPQRPGKAEPGRPVLVAAPQGLGKALSLDSCRQPARVLGKGGFTNLARLRHDGADAALPRVRVDADVGAILHQEPSRLACGNLPPFTVTLTVVA